jgi:superfamily II DNA or RNA helicase
MVMGPNMRQLISEGYLTEYRVFAPPNDIDLTDVAISKSTGDYNINQVRDVVGSSSLIAGDGKSKIVGDIVTHYKRIANGKLGVTFVPSVNQAEEVVRQFNEVGVPAKVLSAKTPDEERAAVMRQFRERKILQIVNVDLLGEGVDVPAIEVVSMARPTASYSLYIQQFGRALRLLDGKDYALVIDHAGNVLRHGLPDAKREWSLDRREKRSASTDNSEALRVCMDHRDGAEGCYQYFERFLKVCPHCGLEIEPPKPSERNAPEQVDGDLYELDAETLAKMRGDIEAIDTPLQDAIEAYRKRSIANHTPSAYVGTNTRRYAAKLEAQQNALAALREILAHWAGYHRHTGRSDSEIFRLFYLRFGVDWLTCQALDADKSLALSERVALDIGNV